MLHTRVATQTIKDLRACPLVRPRTAGADWKGIQHGELVDEVVRQMRERGWQPDPVRAHLSRRNGADLTASVTIRRLDEEGGYVPALGLSVSNEKRRQLAFYVGGWSHVLESGFVADTFQSERRYVTSFDLKEEVGLALDRYDAAVRRLRTRVHRMVEHQVRPADASMLFLKAGELDLIPERKVTDLWTEYQALDLPTQWGCLMAFGKVAADNSPVDSLDEHLVFYCLVTGKPADAGRERLVAV